MQGENKLNIEEKGYFNGKREENINKRDKETK